MLEAVLSALIGSGPLAVLMSFVIVVLWKENRRLVARYEGDAGDAKTPATPGLISDLVSAAHAREDALREHGERRFDAERQRSSEDLRMLNETLKGYVEE